MDDERVLLTATGQAASWHQSADALAAMRHGGVPTMQENRSILFKMGRDTKGRLTEVAVIYRTEDDDSS